MTPTRRDFVALLLGAPLAYACRGGGDDVRTPPSVLLDTGMTRGHPAVRDAGAPPAVTAWRQARVVVIGAGIAGLTAAWELRRRGVTDVVVLELCDVAGGTARGGATDVTAYPWGAHYVVAPQPAQTDMIALLGEMGAIEGHDAAGAPIIDEALRCREPEERVFYRGRWYEGLYLDAGSTAEDRRQLAVFKREIDEWAAWHDAAGARAFAIPTRASSPSPEVRALDQVSFAAWLDARELTSERLRWLADYACRDDYGLLAADTSAWAGLFYFAARQRAAGVAPQSVVTWPDGNHALVRHLAAGAAIETGVAVHEVREVAGGVEVVATGPHGPLGIRAAAAVVAVPGFVADRIVASRRGGPPAPKGDYGAWCVANVHLRDRPRERSRGSAPPAWDNVFRDSPSLGYVSATHQAGRDRGATVWTWYYPFPGDAVTTRKQLAGAGAAEWTEVVMTDLERAHPGVRALVEHVEIAFWGHGMIRPRVGSVWGRRPPDLDAASRVQIAHTDRSGLALFEEAFDHGLAAARAIAGQLA